MHPTRPPASSLTPLRLLGLGCLAVLAACQGPAPQKPEPPRPIAVSQLPGMQSDDLLGLDQAMHRQCQLPRPPGNWKALCAELAGVHDPDALRQWLSKRFVAKEALDDSQPEGLLTGYYEPLLTGSREQEHPGQVPVRALPPDLLTIDLSAVAPQLKGMRLRGRLDGQKVVPYLDRRAIEARESHYGMAGQPVIAWADDAVDAFFLEIQGSGRVQLRDGSLLRVGYADQNGHPYQAIGKTLVQRGYLKREDVTGPAIQAWLRENPDKARDVMHTNPGVVFFRELPTNTADPEAGPIGALSVPLTPERSIAVDRSKVPLGSVVYLQSTNPVTQQPIQRFVMAQDTGGAIRGGRRADYFWGYGHEAGITAGLMKAPVRMWVLTPVQ